MGTTTWKERQANKSKFVDWDGRKPSLNRHQSSDDFLKQGGKVERDVKLEIIGTYTYHIKEYLREIGCKWDEIHRCWYAPDQRIWDKAQERLARYTAAADSQKTAIKTASAKYARHDNKPKASPRPATYKYAKRQSKK